MTQRKHRKRPLATLESIRAMVRRIVRAYKPERIVLFGSYARGNPTADSDVDLLVILRTRRETAEVAAEVEGIADPPFPVDILVSTPEDMKRRLAEGECFMTEIIERGKVLHEARHARVG